MLFNQGAGAHEGPQDDLIWFNPLLLFLFHLFIFLRSLLQYNRCFASDHLFLEQLFDLMHNKTWNISYVSKQDPFWFHVDFTRWEVSKCVQHPLFFWSSFPIAFHKNLEQKGMLMYIPVLLNEALVLFRRLDGLQGVGHFSVNTHHLIMKYIRQIKIFLQNLLPKRKKK